MTPEFRKISRLVLGTSFLIAIFSVIGSPQSGSDIAAKLGLNPAEAKEGVLQSLVNGSVFNSSAFKAFKALAPSARAAIVRNGLALIKSYTETGEFKAEYAKFRTAEKPEPPASRPSVEDELKTQKADFEKQIAEMRKNVAGLDAETRKAMEAAIKQMQTQMEAMDKNPETKTMMRRMLEASRVEDKNQYAEQLRVWEENYPTDPRILIKKRIRDFLETSADIDFSAKLTASGSKMRFANEDYEGKSSEWKICFRAGKEATEAARAFAQTWLQELEKS